MAIDGAELRRGLAETGRYLLSHHVPAEYYRCYSPVVLGRRIHVCARCAGIYPGILLGLVAAVLAPPTLTGLGLIAVFPLPALVEWTVTARTSRRGYNAIRTITGSLLGYAYGLGLWGLFGQGDLRVVAIGIAYGVCAAFLLSRVRTDAL